MATSSKKKILVPTDFSDTSLKALDHGITLAKLLNAEITLLHVMEDFTATVALGGRYASDLNLKELQKESFAHRKKHLEALSKSLKKDNMINVTPLAVTGRTHVEIVRAADKLKAAFIVMGTHGASGSRKLMAGSNAYRVVKDANCPVLSVQEHTRKPGFKNILVPFTDQPHSREKVENAIEMAKLYKASLAVVGVDTELSQAHFRKIQREAEQVETIAEKRGIASKSKVLSQAYDPNIILKHAKDIRADLIVIMSKIDKMSISDYFKEGFVHGIVNRSPVPVLSIPPSFNPDTIDLRFY